MIGCRQSLVTNQSCRKRLPIIWLSHTQAITLCQTQLVISMTILYHSRCVIFLVDEAHCILGWQPEQEVARSVTQNILGSWCKNLTTLLVHKISYLKCQNLVGISVQSTQTSLAQSFLYTLSLSLLQAGLDPSSEGSATRVLRLHLALFSTSIRSTHKSSMLYFTTSIHLFLCLPLLRCPHTSASKILLTQSSSSRRCTCPNHLNLASRTLSMMHATPRMRRILSFLFLSLNVRPRIHLSILFLVLSKRSSSRLFNVHVSEP